MNRDLRMAALLASMGLSVGPNGLMNTKSGVSATISKEERAKRKAKKKIAKASRRANRG